MELGFWKWAIFNVFVVTMLALDLGVFHRKAHVVKLKEALIWSTLWIALALVYNGLVYLWMGEVKALEFLTGYLVEKSLSMDNVFVIALIFSYFKTPPEYQHRVLFWGILGALIMRGIMIGIGATLIARFTWIAYVFGAFLILTGARMAVEKEREIDPDRNPLVRLFRKFMPITGGFHG